MITQTHVLLQKLIEDRMAKKPTPALKGIPIGSYQEIMDDAGKVILQRKKRKRSVPQEIASRNKRRFKRIAK